MSQYGPIGMVILEGIMAIKGHYHSMPQGWNWKDKFIFDFSNALRNYNTVVEADIGEFDNFLKAQTEEAYKISLNPCVPTLEYVTNELNLHVHLAWENSTTIRRKG
ncbi:hypothetical protein CR513_23958, partial [Mucuna pruriens]